MKFKLNDVDLRARRLSELGRAVSIFCTKMSQTFHSSVRTMFSWISIINLSIKSVPAFKPCPTSFEVNETDDTVGNVQVKRNFKLWRVR